MKLAKNIKGKIKSNKINKWPNIYLRFKRKQIAHFFSHTHTIIHGDQLYFQFELCNVFRLICVRFDFIKEPIKFPLTLERILTTQNHRLSHSSAV